MLLIHYIWEFINCKFEFSTKISSRTRYSNHNSKWTTHISAQLNTLPCSGRVLRTMFLRPRNRMMVSTKTLKLDIDTRQGVEPGRAAQNWPSARQPTLFRKLSSFPIWSAQVIFSHYNFILLSSKIHAFLTAWAQGCLTYWYTPINLTAEN